MKKLSVIAILFIVFVLASCSGPTNNAGNSEDDPENANLAKVVIPLPSVSNARAITLEDAKTHTNFFEVSFKNIVTDDVYYASATIEQGKIETIIPPGTYDILLFAGVRVIDINDVKWYHLSASSYKEEVTISLEETNTVNLILALIDLEVTVPSKVVIDEEFLVTVYVDVKNPLINITDATIYYHPIGTIGPDEEIVHPVIIKNENTFTYSTSFHAPSTAANGRIIVKGHVQMNSMWYYTVILPATGEIRNQISFVEGADVDINISWPE